MRARGKPVVSLHTYAITSSGFETMMMIASGEVRLELEITPGSEVAATVLGALDVDSDGEITEAEARIYAEDVLAQSALLLDGESVGWTLDEVSVPGYPFLELGSGTINTG